LSLTDHPVHRDRRHILPDAGPKKNGLSRERGEPRLPKGQADTAFGQGSNIIPKNRKGMLLIIRSLWIHSGQVKPGGSDF
jgi:hypothetical protein